MLNPARASWLVALVGLKVWLFYIPLAILAYHYADDRDRLLVLIRRLLLIGAVPAGIGIVSSLLIATGYRSLVFAMYGPAANGVFQGYAATGLGDALLFRVPSTFTLVFQYFQFCMAMLALSYGLWAGRDVRSRSILPLGLLTLYLVAALLSGSKAAFTVIPGYAVLTQILDRRLKLLGGLAVAFLLALVLWLRILGATVSDVLGPMIQWAVDYAFTIQPQEFLRAFELTTLGLGTGMNTGAARYVISLDSIYGLENYYAKTVVELGLLGLIILIGLFCSLLWRAARIRLAVREPALRGLSTGIVAFLFFAVVYQWKGWFLDLDPLNVYFWVFIGLLARIPSVDWPAGRSAAADERPPDRDGGDGACESDWPRGSPGSAASALR
jgi:hypothetical protein